MTAASGVAGYRTRGVADYMTELRARGARKMRADAHLALIFQRGIRTYDEWKAQRTDGYYEK